jgi:crotonobetainyl-CoA:carnitine CoA-transferase CaiB-like acyl-CoA transferase
LCSVARSAASVAGVTGCLDGTRVLELARYQAGPRSGMVLSDLGAEVIKIEKPGGESTRRSAPVVDGHSIYFNVYNRGKKSICLDLRQDEGREIFRELVKTADFILENFRPGTMERMGLGYEDLKAIKSDIIMIRVSAFGQDSSGRNRPGFDPIGQALSGLMALTGQPEGRPVGTASSVVDRYTALHATIGALAALRHRDRTGEGQVVDVCLMDSAFTMTEIPMIHYLTTGEEGGESGRPPYRAADGYVIVMPGSRQMTQRLLRAMGITPDEEEAAELPATAHRGRWRQAIADWCQERTRAEICATLEQADVPVAAVLTIPDVVQQASLWEREMLLKVPDAAGGEIYVPGVSMKLSKTPGRAGPVPTAGEHTEEILGALESCGPARLAELRTLGVIS